MSCQTNDRPETWISHILGLWIQFMSYYRKRNGVVSGISFCNFTKPALHFLCFYDKVLKIKIFIFGEKEIILMNNGKGTLNFFFFKLKNQKRRLSYLLKKYLNNYLLFKIPFKKIFFLSLLKFLKCVKQDSGF